MAKPAFERYGDLEIWSSGPGPAGNLDLRSTCRDAVTPASRPCAYPHRMSSTLDVRSIESSYSKLPAYRPVCEVWKLAMVGESEDDVGFWGERDVISVQGPHHFSPHPISSLSSHPPSHHLHLCVCPPSIPFLLLSFLPSFIGCSGALPARVPCGYLPRQV